MREEIWVWEVCEVGEVENRQLNQEIARFIKELIVVFVSSYGAARYSLQACTMQKFVTACVKVYLSKKLA